MFEFKSIARPWGSLPPPPPLVSIYLHVCMGYLMPNNDEQCDVYLSIFSLQVAEANHNHSNDIVRDPGADSGGEGKSKRAGKYKKIIKNIYIYIFI